MRRNACMKGAKRAENARFPALWITTLTHCDAKVLHGAHFSLDNDACIF